MPSAPEHRRLYLSLSGVGSCAAEIAARLRAAGYEVNDQRKDWRVLMWRRDHRQWSQAHHGTTNTGLNGRAHLTLSGPEWDAPIRGGATDAA